MTIVEAIYERGVLRLESPIPFADGTRVEVIVIPHSIEAESSTPAEILASIAALPSDSDDAPFSGRDHDRVLYGQSDAG